MFESLQQQSLYFQINFWLLLCVCVLAVAGCCLPFRHTEKSLTQNSEYTLALYSRERVLALIFLILSGWLYLYSYFKFNTCGNETQAQSSEMTWFKASIPFILYSPLLINYVLSRPFCFKIHLKHLVSTFVCMMSIYILIYVYSISGAQEILIELTKTPRTQDVIETIRKAPKEQLYQYFYSAVIVAPIVEEVFFRGFIFNVLKRTSGLLAAACISGLFFAAVHLSLNQTAALTIFGVVQCFLYVRTKSIIYPILLHMVFNAIELKLILS